MTRRIVTALVVALGISMLGACGGDPSNGDNRPIALVDAKSSASPTTSADAAKAAAAAAAKAAADAKAKAAADAKAKAAADAAAKAKAAAAAKAKAAAAAKAKAAAAAAAAAAEAEAEAAAAAAVPEDVYYENCTAARAAGAAPVYRGDPGYSKKLDRDGDGVGCES